jgi:peptidyl-prolyl cis-trans isomerase B (cyclophilin B)
MDVIEKIENQATTSRAGHRDVPVDIIVIEKVEVIE